MLETHDVTAPTPVLLALDTATDRLHLALHSPAGSRALDLPGGAQASVSVLPALQQLLADEGLSWSDVDAVACGLGPGAFTGLRTACSVVQGVALGLDRPTLGLDTLMAVAEDARQRHPDQVMVGQWVWVLQDARMGELYVAAYEWSGQFWVEQVPAALWPLDEPARRWAAESEPPAKVGAGAMPLVLVGSGWRVWPEAVTQALASRVQHHDPDACPSGQALMALALTAWQRGERLDAALLLPRYVRDKVAQTTTERLQARQVAA